MYSVLRSLSPITKLYFVISSVGEKSLNCISWHILPLNCYRIFFLLSLVPHFLTQKVPKTSAHGKNSHPFLGSGVAMRHPSVEKSLTLNLFFCFTALRSLCGKALFRKYNAPHGKQSSLSPVKQKSLSCVFQRCRFAFGDGLPLLEITKTVPLSEEGRQRGGALRCFQRALAALVACENEFSLTRWHKPCDDWNVRANESRG